MAEKKDVTMEEVRETRAEVDGQDPPGLPPPPPFTIDVTASAVSSGAGGATVGLVVATSLNAPIVQAMTGAMQASRGEMSGMTFAWWIIMGFVFGAIYGVVSGLVYNAMIKNSEGIKNFRAKYPAAQSLPHDQLFMFWVEERLVHLFHYLRDNFQRK